MPRLNFEIHDDFFIQPWGNGVRVIPPKLSKKCLGNNYRSLEYISKFSCNVYYLKVGSEIAYSNELNANTCGNMSVNEILGKSAFDLCKRQIASQLVCNDVAVMQHNRNLIFEEKVGNDDLFIRTISIKYPAYNFEGKINGVFGFAIVLDTQPVAQSLSQIKSLGLLGPTEFTPTDKCLDTYLSRRELECLHLIVRGKSAKEISKMLGISARTVEGYIENIKLKMNVLSKSELIDRGNEFFARIHPLDTVARKEFAERGEELLPVNTEDDGEWNGVLGDRFCYEVIGDALEMDLSPHMKRALKIGLHGIFNHYKTLIRSTNPDEVSASFILPAHNRVLGFSALYSEYGNIRDSRRGASVIWEIFSELITSNYFSTKQLL